MSVERDRAPRVGDGQLLKALTKIDGITDLQFRISAIHLAHANPPREFTVYVKTKTIATMVGCTTRSVELCRAWLEQRGLVTLVRGGGRGRLTLVDFTPLARSINPEASFGVSDSETPKLRAQTPNLHAETPKLRARVYEKDPSGRTQWKDGERARRIGRRRSAVEEVYAAHAAALEGREQSSRRAKFLEDLRRYGPHNAARLNPELSAAEIEAFSAQGAGR